MRTPIALIALVALAALSACPPPPCSATCTTGCCDPNGVCLGGKTKSECGTGGALCAACGADDVCSTAQMCVPDSYADVNAFIADVLPALCERAVRCKGANAQATCEDVVRKRLVTSDGRLTGQAIDVLYVDAAAAVKDGRATFDGVKGKKCLKAVRTLACEDVSSTRNADCDATFVGKVMDNGSCFFDGDCARTSYCTSTATTCPGTCQPRKAAGASASRDAECQEGLYVYDGRCLAFAAANSSCARVAGATARQTCTAGYYCGAGDICLQRGTVNATCSSSDACNPSLVCSNGTCQTPGALNATCNVMPMIPCQLDLRCDLPNAGQPGTCQLLGAASAACWVTTDCQTDLYCDGARLIPTPARGTCAARKAVSAACTGAGQCVSTAYCELPGSATCAMKKAANTSCTALPADQCVDGHNCSAGTCRPTACHDPTP